MGLGAITKNQARGLTILILSALEAPYLFNELAFTIAFNIVDKDKDGAIDHNEAKELVDKIANPTKKIGKKIGKKIIKRFRK